MKTKKPCKGCIQKYTNQFNEVEGDQLCPFCIDIELRRAGVDLAQGQDLSTITIVGLDKKGGLEYTQIIPKESA